MNGKFLAAVAAGASASGLAIAAHVLLGHDGVAACLPEIAASTALVGAAGIAMAKARSKAAS